MGQPEVKVALLAHVKKASAVNILSKGVSSTSGTGKVSAAEQTRIRRARKKGGYFAQATEKNILEALRASTDIVHDWPPNVSWWKKVAACLIPLPQMTYNRAALEYLRVWLEQMPRDVIAHLNPQAIEEVEIGLGRKILVEKKGARHPYQMRPPTPAQLTAVSTMGGGKQIERCAISSFQIAQNIGFYVPDLFDRRLHNLVLVPAQLKHDGGSSSVPAAGTRLRMLTSTNLGA